MTLLFRLGLALVVAAVGMMEFCKVGVQHLASDSATATFVLALRSISPEMAQFTGAHIIIPAVVLLMFIGLSLLLVETTLELLSFVSGRIHSIRVWYVLRAEQSNRSH